MLADFVKLGRTENGVPELQFEQLPFSHPLFLMYSSGTTGLPKCMVHSAGVSNITSSIGIDNFVKKTVYFRMLACVLVIYN